MAALISLFLAASSTSPTAEEAIATSRRRFKPLAELDCPRSPDGEEIVVCGRRAIASDPSGPTLPVAPVPGQRIRRLPGEAPTGKEAMVAADACIDRCSTGGTIMIDVIKNAKRLKNALESVLN